MRYITYSCRFAKNRLPKYAPSRCEGKAARMPPTAYGGALRKAQEAPERRGRFKSDHLQKRGSLSLILSHIKFNCKFVKNRLPKYAPRKSEQIRAVRDLQRARSAKFPAQDLRASPITRCDAQRHSVCPHKELQSACISFVTFEKMKHINLRPAGAVPQAATGASASERGGRA